MFNKKDFAIVSYLKFISRTNFMLSRAEHENSFITLGLGRPKAVSLTVLFCLHIGYYDRRVVSCIVVSSPFFRCFRKAVFRDCCLSEVTSFILLDLTLITLNKLRCHSHF